MPSTSSSSMQTPSMSLLIGDRRRTIHGREFACCARCAPSRRSSASNSASAAAIRSARFHHGVGTGGHAGGRDARPTASTRKRVARSGAAAAPGRNAAAPAHARSSSRTLRPGARPCAPARHPRPRRATSRPISAYSTRAALMPGRQARGSRAMPLSTRSYSSFGRARAAVARRARRPASPRAARTTRPGRRRPRAATAAAGRGDRRAHPRRRRARCWSAASPRRDRRRARARRRRARPSRSAIIAPTVPATRAA